MSIEIRQIQETDITGFHSALSEVASEGVYLLTTSPPPYEKMAKFVHNNIKQNNAQYVAVLDNQIIAWADIVPYERSSMSHVGLLGMGVLSDYRNKGIGGEILEKTIAHAWSQQLTRLELEVFSDNPVAIRLYRNNNFKIEGVKMKARLFENEYQDIVIMAQVSN